MSLSTPGNSNTMENDFIENIDDMEEELQVARFILRRPFPGIHSSASGNGDAVDTSGIDSFLVLIRILMAHDCPMVVPLPPADMKLPHGEGCTLEEKAVIKAARSNLGFSKEFDTKVKLELMSQLFPDFTKTKDLCTYEYPSLKSLIKEPRLANLFEENLLFLLHKEVHTMENGKSLRKRNIPKLRFEIVIRVPDISRQSLQKGLELVRVQQAETEDTMSMILFGCRAPFLRFNIAEGDHAALDTKDILRITNEGMWEVDGTHSAFADTYGLFLVLKHAGKDGSQDRIRMYRVGGEELFPQISNPDINPPFSSVRNPEGWSMKDGNALTLIYVFLGELQPKLAEHPREFNAFRAWKNPEKSILAPGIPKTSQNPEKPTQKVVQDQLLLTKPGPEPKTDGGVSKDKENVTTNQTKPREPQNTIPNLSNQTPVKKTAPLPGQSEAFAEEYNRAPTFNRSMRPPETRQPLTHREFSRPNDLGREQRGSDYQGGFGRPNPDRMRSRDGGSLRGYNSQQPLGSGRPSSAANTPWRYPPSHHGESSSRPADLNDIPNPHTFERSRDYEYAVWARFEKNGYGKWRGFRTTRDIAKSVQIPGDLVREDWENAQLIMDNLPALFEATRSQWNADDKRIAEEAAKTLLNLRNLR